MAQTVDSDEVSGELKPNYSTGMVRDSAVTVVTEDPHQVVGRFYVEKGKVFYESISGEGPLASLDDEEDIGVSAYDLPANTLKESEDLEGFVERVLGKGIEKEVRKAGIQAPETRQYRDLNHTMQDKNHRIVEERTNDKSSNWRSRI